MVCLFFFFFFQIWTFYFVSGYNNYQCVWPACSRLILATCSFVNLLSFAHVPTSVISSPTSSAAWCSLMEATGDGPEYISGLPHCSWRASALVNTTTLCLSVYAYTWDMLHRGQYTFRVSIRKQVLFFFPPPHLVLPRPWKYFLIFIKGSWNVNSCA